ncbi:class I SAM-dependent methyltransferase [Streptomyces sp. NPDC059063]|uniref:class I SAM-dependent methyltransferase n=1 Tax=unclassified Streptomyces TaxID=2593676 RepID=UPI0036A337E2
MPTIPSGRTPQSAQEPHQERQLAESFGADAARYDRTRPHYPDALVRAVVAASPGPDVLDVGCGTGIAARQFQAAGCTVLGVDVDARMAAYARRGGVAVEVAAFEAWDPGGRAFDAVVAGQTWHWIDPVAGAATAARVLRPGGCLALFWNVFQPPPALAETFSAVHRRVLPDAPRNPWTPAARDGYAPVFTQVTDGIRRTEAFDAPRRQHFDWERSYTRDEWLDQLPTGADAAQIPSARLAELLTETGAVIDALGGSFTMPYRAVLITAARTDTP